MYKVWDSSESGIGYILSEAFEEKEGVDWRLLAAGTIELDGIISSPWSYFVLGEYIMGKVPVAIELNVMVSFVGFDINAGSEHYVIEALHWKSLQRKAKKKWLSKNIAYEFNKGS